MYTKELHTVLPGRPSMPGPPGGPGGPSLPFTPSLPWREEGMVSITVMYRLRNTVIGIRSRAMCLR